MVEWLDVLKTDWAYVKDATGNTAWVGSPSMARAG